MCSGSFKYQKNSVLFSPRKERNRLKINLPIYIASSAIKSLFLFDMYINFIGQPNDILIIDEPELNLHPDNQLMMARFLARLVNSGVKLLISTHSDFLLRELNNLIMLSNNFKEKESFLKKYKLISKDILSPGDVKVYSVTKTHSTSQVPVDNYGINLKAFDALINKSNIMADELYFSIEQ